MKITTSCLFLIPCTPKLILTQDHHLVYLTEQYGDGHLLPLPHIQNPLSTPFGYSALPVCRGTGLCRLSSLFCYSQFTDSNAPSRHRGVSLEEELSYNHLIWHRKHLSGSFPDIFWMKSCYDIIQRENTNQIFAQYPFPCEVFFVSFSIPFLSCPYIPPA